MAYAATTIDIWTICDHPTDFPDQFTACRHVAEAGRSYPTGELLVADDIEALRREMVERGLVCIGRQAGDDPVIVECWI